MIGNLLNGMTETTGAIKTTLDTITYSIFAVCAGLMGLYAIWIGYKMATAQDDNARTQAKAQLISAIIGIVVVGGLAGLTVTADMITTAVGNTQGGVKGLSALMTVISDAVTAITKTVMCAASLFGLYLGWNFMKADSDDKRKQAKTQLIYTLIAIVVMVMVGSLGKIILDIAAPAPSGGGGVLLPRLGQ